LTSVGRAEHFGIGKRLHDRLSSLFIRRPKLSVITSGKQRAVDSAHAFIRGLTQSQSDLEISYEQSDQSILYFHKSSTDYLLFKTSDSNIKMKIDSIKNLDRTRSVARQVLKRIYHDEFVHKLIHGHHHQNYQRDANKLSINSTTIVNEVDVVLRLYLLLSVAPAQSSKQMAELLKKYFSRDESKWFAYVNDAQVFPCPSIQSFVLFRLISDVIV
jgi:hypothetical protein